MIIRSPILLLALAALPSLHAQAHEMRPAYLEIRESERLAIDGGQVRDRSGDHRRRARGAAEAVGVLLDRGTALEVAVYLRLCEPDATPDEVARAVRCVHRLVRLGKLRPVQPGREYTFALAELARYVHDETESFETQSDAH